LTLAFARWWRVVAMPKIVSTQDKDGNLTFLEYDQIHRLYRIQKPDLLWVSDWVNPAGGELPYEEEPTYDGCCCLASTEAEREALLDQVARLRKMKEARHG
jgi:hypothetical protein